MPSLARSEYEWRRQPVEPDLPVQDDQHLDEDLLPDKHFSISTATTTITPAILSLTRSGYQRYHEFVEPVFPDKERQELDQLDEDLLPISPFSSFIEVDPDDDIRSSSFTELEAIDEIQMPASPQDVTSAWPRSAVSSSPTPTNNQFLSSLNVT